MEKRNSEGQTLEEFLAAYRPGDYERPSVTVDMLIFGVDEEKKNLKVLLSQRRNHPYIECWAFPGGFIEMEESAYHAACRELEEETGIRDVYMEQLYTFSQPDRDPRTRVLSIAYMALVPVIPVKAGDDAKDAAWFDVEFSEDKITLDNQDKRIHIEYEVEEKDFQNGTIVVKNKVPGKALSEERMAFDHDEILLEGITRLRNKVRYTDIAFGLLPPKFTMPEVRKVYELVMGLKIHQWQIDRMTKEYVVETGEEQVSTGGRPAKLYRHRGCDESAAE